MYRTISGSFWTDPKVMLLNPGGKLLLLYFITNPHTHVSGIYVLPRPVIQLETGLTKPTLDTLCYTLSKVGVCAFDEPKNVVWVRKMMSYQGKGEKNARSAAAHLREDLHNSFLCLQFLNTYPDVMPFVAPTFIDTLSHTVSGTRTPEQDPEQEQDQKPEQSLGKRPAKHPTQPPENLPITAEMANFATSLGVCDIQRETEAMLDHFRGKGESRADWVATWRTWMRNSKRFGGVSGKHKSKTDRNRENAEKLLSRFDFEDGGRGGG